MVSSPSPFPTLPYQAKIKRMQKKICEDSLTLGLSINNSSWYSNPISKKRKMDNENKFFTLLQAREKMLQDTCKRNGLEHGKGLELIHLLLISATSIDANSTTSAIDSLTELYQNASLNGDPIQRVMAYFADGLAARLLTQTSPFYNKIIANPTPEQNFSAFTYLYRASPYHQFAHFTANQSIIEAFDNDHKKGLHVIDFDVSYGFQWPSLIQSLSDKATKNKPISLRITGFGQSLEELRETKTRLTNFAKGCNNLLFEFNDALPGSKIKIKKDETLVVNMVFYLQSLPSSKEISSTLRDIHSLDPSLVILVEKGGSSRMPQSFLSRFMESLHYFAAMFDSLDDCLPSESRERLSIEKNHLGREIKKLVIAGDGIKDEKTSKCEILESWKERMESNGFEGVKMSSRSISQAKLLLKIKSHRSGANGGFRIFERDEGRSLSLGWQDRNLISASAWRCLT